MKTKMRSHFVVDVDLTTQLKIYWLALIERCRFQRPFSYCIGNYLDSVSREVRPIKSRIRNGNSAEPLKETVRPRLTRKISSSADLANVEFETIQSYGQVMFEVSHSSFDDPVEYDKL